MPERPKIGSPQVEPKNVQRRASHDQNAKRDLNGAAQRMQSNRLGSLRRRLDDFVGKVDRHDANFSTPRRR
jgi:hypothetical protein